MLPNEISFTTFDVPDVKTILPDVSTITSTDAICGGNIISNGGTAVTQSGLCWGIAPEPTISGFKNTGSNTRFGNYSCQSLNNLVRKYNILCSGLCCQ